MSTRIAWTDEVWNPVTGCSKVSPGCAHCYAERLSQRFGRSFDVTLHPERLDQPLRWRKPRRVFVCSMSDLFHEQVPDDFIHSVFQVMERADLDPDEEGRGHTFQVLTKRPGRMRDLVTWLYECQWCDSGCPMCGGRGYKLSLENVWLGVSIESDRYVGRADILRQTPAAVRFISAEPLLGPLPSLDLAGISWLIIGGESGPGFRPMDPAWVRDLVDRADAAGIPVFVKQAAGLRPGRQGDLPDSLWARKEWPR